MSIYKSSNVGSVYKGSSVISDIYKGSSVVYNSSVSGPDGFIFRELSDDGVLSLPTGELPIFDWVTEIKDYEGYFGFSGCTGLTGEVSFPRLTNVGNSGLYYGFSRCTGLTSVSFSKLTSIDNHGLYSCFYGCTGLTGSVSFPKLTSIGANGLAYCFRNTKFTEVHFPKALEGNTQCTSSKMGCGTNTTVYFDL